MLPNFGALPIARTTSVLFCPFYGVTSGWRGLLTPIGTRKFPAGATDRLQQRSPARKRVHARCEIGGAFEQPADHRIGIVVEQSAEPFRNARKLRRELPGILFENAQFAIVQFEEFTVHGVTF